MAGSDKDKCEATDRAAKILAEKYGCPGERRECDALNKAHRELRDIYCPSGEKTETPSGANTVTAHNCLPLLLSALRDISEGIGYNMVKDYIHAQYSERAREYVDARIEHARKQLMQARKECPDLEDEINKTLSNVYTGASELTLAEAEYHIRKTIIR